MISSIKDFFNRHLDPSKCVSEESKIHALQLATAALFIEMMEMDQKVTEEEIEVVKKALIATFDISAEDTEKLVKLAEHEAKQSTGYYEFTTLINKEFDQQAKVKIVELLWQVAYADLEIDKYEEHMIRKVADLLYVSHKDFIEAKHKVLKTKNS